MKLEIGTQDHYPLEKKLSNLLEWIDLPLEARPQLILGAFGVSLFL